MFDPQAHSLCPARPFDDFRVGEVFRMPSRTVTAATFAAFQALSGDNHPVHYDRPYLARMGHPALLAHGLQTLCTSALGASLLAHQMGEALIGFLEQTSRFLAPVYEGDTLYPEVEITALTPQKTTGVMHLAMRIHNQHGTCVCDGTQAYLMRLQT